MDQKILDAIQQSLPAMQMDALRKELDRAKMHDNVLDEFKELKVRYDLRQNEVNQLTSQVSELKNKILKQEELDKREQKLEVELMKKDLACAQQILAGVKELAMAAFRNPTIMKTYYRQENLEPGQCSNPVSLSSSATETRD